VALSINGLYVLSIADAQARLLDLPVRPMTGIDVWEDTVAVSDAGRIYFPAHGADDPTVDIYSVDLGGQDLRNLTSPSPRNLPALGPILSPDQDVVAFRVGEDSDGPTWTVGTDGSDMGVLSGDSGVVSWQPVP
jgi:hypothetical protein